MLKHIGGLKHKYIFGGINRLIESKKHEGEVTGTLMKWISREHRLWQRTGLDLLSIHATGTEKLLTISSTLVWLYRQLDSGTAAQDGGYDGEE